MNSKDYMEFHRDCCAKMIAITAAKNADYAGGGGDAFANFALSDAFGVCSIEAGFFTRMTDKFSRIASFIKKGILMVKDESVEDTLLDLANYCILFAGFLRAKRDTESSPAPSVATKLNLPRINRPIPKPPPIFEDDEETADDSCD